jgi:NAD(P) transhydrogenase subunit alpha
MSEEYLAAEQAMIAQHAKEVDIIVTTALVPGMSAPKLVTSGAVVSMRAGSVIVDLAAEQGGNCALTEPDRVVERFGVTIIGLTDLASRMAQQASELYATTIYNLLEDLLDERGAFAIDLEDEVHRGALVLHQGELTWPLPRPRPREAAPRSSHTSPKPTGSAMPGWAVALLAGLLAVAGALAPPEFLTRLTIFLLACVVGWHVIWNVTPALHTPLMSVTNAISGIILVGGMLLVTGTTTAGLLGTVAVLLATINVAGGFLVTQRMLRMFRK